MRKESGRPRRVGALMQRELADLIRNTLHDAEAAKANVTGVDTAPDLSHAKVYVTHLRGRARAKPVLDALNAAAGFLRRELARRLKLRSVPELRFHYDDSIERGIELSRLIERARSSDRGDE